MLDSYEKGDVLHFSQKQLPREMESRCYRSVRGLYFLAIVFVRSIISFLGLFRQSVLCTLKIVLIFREHVSTS